jgi:hypothetical protein
VCGVSPHVTTEVDFEEEKSVIRNWQNKGGEWDETADNLNARFPSLQVGGKWKVRKRQGHFEPLRVTHKVLTNAGARVEPAGV